MTIVVVGYIKDFKLPCSRSCSKEDVKIVEGVSERIDYIRSNNLEKKESFTLIPKFVTDTDGKQLMIFIQKIDILTSLRKKRKPVDFSKVQSRPFFDSRQILVTTQKLKDLFPINTLIINWGTVFDTISYLKSAETQIYDISTIFIHKKIQNEEVTKFLNNHYFTIHNEDKENNKEDKENNKEDADYVIFENNKPNIKSLIFKEPNDILEYTLVPEHDLCDIIALNWNIHMHLPFDRYFPCRDHTIYFDSKTDSQRIKNTILFGNSSTMIRLAEILNDKRVIFLDSLRSEGFNLASFN
jgi:hypothetical protein